MSFSSIEHLIDRHPAVSPERLIAQLVPPPIFAEVRFSTYQPDPSQQTQHQALQSCIDFCQQVYDNRQFRSRRWRRKKIIPGIGIYLDGGFGVGKTHLLASIYRQLVTMTATPCIYASFMEITQLAGVLGFSECIELLADHAVVCIDEFELDDPGNTTLVSRLLSELVDRGVSLAATSNTLPDQLGEGRFAVQDFLREIDTLSRIFSTIHIDGADYRQRGLPDAPVPLTDQQIQQMAYQHSHRVSLDDFDQLCDHLASMHPSRYGLLVDEIEQIFITGIHQVSDDNVGLRLVSFIDQVYDNGIPVMSSGIRIDHLFTPEMLQGSYRKKYLRALSRLLALSTLPIKHPHEELSHTINTTAQ